MSTIESQTVTVKETGPGNAKRLECRFCQKAYSKAEHLTRHERSHTGVRPFTCKECRRSFSRQDSLARHEKLHLRRDSTKPALSPAAPTPVGSVGSIGSVAPPTLPTPEHSIDSSCAEWLGQPQPQVQDVFMDMPPNQELDFQLIWPDSEDLFQSLMSAEAAPYMPLGTLPVSSEFDPANLRDSFDLGGSGSGAIPTGRGHQAVHGVSKMIANLSSSVTAEVEASSITSVFLDECLHMFFVRFIPTFPILHRPTFVFRECTHPLLLVAMAIGSLYLGPKTALAKGEALWRLAHTAVSTSWQSLITHHGQYDATKGLQLVLTALLSQVYAALSKNRALRTTSQIFHGLGFFWARHCAMFDTEAFSQHDLPSLDAPQAEKDRIWRLWAAREIQRRALLAHYILDGQIAQMSGDPTATRHAANQLGLPSSDAAFEATNAADWLIQMRANPVPETSFRNIFRSLFSSSGLINSPDYSLSSFSLRVVLEGLQSLVSDCEDIDGAVVGVPARSEVRTALAQMHETIVRNTQLSTEDMLETLLRWHSICLDAATDSSLICRQLCARYNVEQQVLGGGKGIQPGFDLYEWARTDDARRALLHAVAIQNIVEQLPRGRAHVIHMPNSLFAAATVYGVFSMAGFSNIHLPRTMDWKHALFTEADPCVILGELSGSTPNSDTRRFVRGEQLSANRSVATTTRNLLYELNSMQKLFRCLSSQWGVAHEMETIINQWITLSH